MAPSRIFVYGVTGSGKSVLAEQIGTILNLPWYSVDDLSREPGWVQVPVEKQRIRISAICVRECWVLDSAYEKWLDIPLSRVELIVGLDHPRWLSLARLIRRTIQSVLRRPGDGGPRLRVDHAVAAGCHCGRHGRADWRVRRRGTQAVKARSI